MLVPVQAGLNNVRIRGVDDGFRIGYEWQVGLNTLFGDSRPGSTTLPPSRPGGFHPEPLTDPCVTVSRHTARAILNRAAALRRNQRAPPVSSWPSLRSRRDGLPPSLHGHYSASSLLRGSPPLDAASVLSSSWLQPLVTSPFASTSRFPRSTQPPLPGSAHLYAGCRSVRKQVPPELVPRSSNYRGFDIVSLFSTRKRWFPCGPLPGSHLTRFASGPFPSPFPTTLLRAQQRKVV